MDTQHYGTIDMEKLTLTAPKTYPAIADWQVAQLRLDWPGQRIDIMLIGTNSETLNVAYTGATATAFMASLNKANLSVQSLHSRILSRLVVDGFLAGTVTGLPD